MGKPFEHQPVKLIIGLIGKEDQFPEAARLLSKKFGKIDYQSEIIEFNFTRYYEPEMGAGLKRCFLSFSRMISPRALVKIKHYTNRLEKKRFSPGACRCLNIDPGYLTLSKLVLATTKDHQHRIYLDQGIFAEVTLRFRGKSFASWEWTYPDYASDAYIRIFNFIRDNFLARKKGDARG